MNDEIGVRVARLEERVTSQDRELKRLHIDFTKMSEQLGGIQRTLNKIQWIATGALGLWLTQMIGLETVLKGLIL